MVAGSIGSKAPLLRASSYHSRLREAAQKLSYHVTCCLNSSQDLMFRSANSTIRYPTNQVMFRHLHGHVTFFTVEIPPTGSSHSSNSFRVSSTGGSIQVRGDLSSWEKGIDHKRRIRIEATQRGGNMECSRIATAFGRYKTSNACCRTLALVGATVRVRSRSDLTQQ